MFYEMLYDLVLAMGGVASLLGGWLLVQRLGHAQRAAAPTDGADAGAEAGACAVCGRAPTCPAADAPGARASPGHRQIPCSPVPSRQTGASIEPRI